MIEATIAAREEGSDGGTASAAPPN
jgi:hypothetical protein